MRNKVFCIGFHKTGTTSLGNALEILGYRVCGVQRQLLAPIIQDDFSQVIEVVKQFDAFKDNPWPLIFKQLDDQFPDAQFILTVRSAQDWMLSVVNHFGKKTTPMREWIYGNGAPLGNEKIYLKKYVMHNENVMHWFSNRKQKLLVMDISAGDGWQVLCEFLGAIIPKTEFPFKNKRRK